MTDSSDRPAATGYTPEQGRETVNRESHPNAGGPEGLEGDMGTSSERSGPFEGIEATGSRASTLHDTEGESPSVIPDPGNPAPEDEPSVEGQPLPDKPDETSPVTDVDRTVGEVKPNPVDNKHEFDPDKNPRH